MTGPATGNGLEVPTGSLSYALLNSSGATLASGIAPLTPGSGNAATTVPIPETLAPGSYSVSFSFLGDTNYAPSASRAIRVGEVQGQLALRVDGTSQVSL